MAKWFRIPFGDSGDRSAIPDENPGTGEVNYQTGYTNLYQLEQTNSESRDIERPKFQQLMYEITSTLRRLWNIGTPLYITDEENGGEKYLYERGAWVMYDAGDGNGLQRYESLVNDNDQLPTVTTHWRSAMLADYLRKDAMIGCIGMFPMSTARPGWLRITSVPVSRTTYAALFAYLGTTYGAGDGSTTFGLPPVSGRFPRFHDNGAGIDPSRVLGSVQGMQIQEHNHQLPVWSGDGSGAGAVEDTFPGDRTFREAYTYDTGGSETRPVNIALAAFIYTGVE